MGLPCIQNSSLLAYSKSQKVSASYCLPFQHSRGKNQPVGGFRPPPPPGLFRVKVAWVTKLLDDNFYPWKIIPTILFTTFGGINNIFHHNYKASKQCRSKVNRLPKFYQELIHLWSEVGEKSVRTLQKFVVKHSGIILGLCPTVRPFTISILLTKVF